MGREIKFRAWVDTYSRWHMTTSIVLHADGSFFSGGIYSKNEPEWKLLQYTGLKDKNGREIYEGDIEKDENGALSVVCYLRTYGAYCFVPIDVYVYDDYEQLVVFEYGTDCFFENAMPSKYSEIIGNVHENPELLEVQGE